jgi:N-acetylmuramoyl-L-alanine amidase
MPDVVVLMTRENDRKMRLSERGKSAAHTDVVISVHCNASTVPTHTGPRIYIWPGNSRAEAVGKKILHASHDQKNIGGRIHTVRRDDPDVEGDEWLNRPYNVVAAYKPTAVLYETAFMSNPAELTMLRSSQGQQIIALAIVRGIAEFSTLHS